MTVAARLGVRTKRLKYFLDRNDSGTWGDDPVGDEGTPVLRSTDQTVDGRWAIVDPASRMLSDAEARATRLEVGDILVTKSSGSSRHIGKSTLVNEEVAALRPSFGNFMQRLRVRSDEDPRYLWYLLNHAVVRSQFDDLSTTSTGLANLNGSIIGRVEIPDVAPHLQRPIADFLDRETARIDTLIEEQQNLIEMLRERRAATIADALDGCDRIPLRRIVDRNRPMTYGILQAGEPVDGGVPYIGPSDITGEGSSPQRDALRTTDPEIANAYRRSVLAGGDVVVSIGPAYGKVAVVSDDLTGANLTQDTVRLALLPDVVDRRFVVWTLLSRQTADYWDYQVMGATFRRLNLGTLARTPIPLPSLDEQRRIARLLDEQTERIDALIAEAERFIELSKERRSALIAAAVTGQIDVQTGA